MLFESSKCLQCSSHLGVGVSRGLSDIRTVRRHAIRKPDVPHGIMILAPRASVKQLHRDTVCDLATLYVQAQSLVRGRCNPGWLRQIKIPQNSRPPNIVIYQKVPVPLRRGMTLQRTLMSSGGRRDPVQSP
jgi:hypothetical protein